jgi:hypothetical protein
MIYSTGIQEPTAFLKTQACLWETFFHGLFNNRNRFDLAKKICSGGRMGEVKSPARLPEEARRKRQAPAKIGVGEDRFV